jgi:hypothetical protein
MAALTGARTMLEEGEQSINQRGNIKARFSGNLMKTVSGRK